MTAAIAFYESRTTVSAKNHLYCSSKEHKSLHLGWSEDGEINSRYLYLQLVELTAHYNLNKSACFVISTDTGDGSPATEPDECGETEEEGEDDDGQTQQDEEREQMREEEERNETRLDHMQEDDGAIRLLSEPMCFQTGD